MSKKELKQQLDAMQARIEELERRVAMLEARPVGPYIAPQPTWIRPPEPIGTGTPMPPPTYRIWCDTVAVDTKDIGWGKVGL